MPIQLYKCKIAVRSTVKLLPEIKGILSTNENRERLFRNTVFGPWLDIGFCDNDSQLMHFVLQHQVKVSNISPDSPPLTFKIGDDWLEFGRKEFCLITGFRFGKVCKSENQTSAFRDRVFPEKKTDGIKSVYANDCLELIRDDKRMIAVSDDDAVRLCLLVVAMLVFMGIEDRNCIPAHILSLVEDFGAWNDFAWGEYMWHKFYKRTVNVVAKHKKQHLAKLKANPKFSATYNLYGFPWAFKIWILESYPKSRNWWAKDTAVIPRGLAWSSTSKKFRKADYKKLFGPESIPILALYATKGELSQPWCIASIPFIKGLADRDPSCDAEKDDAQQAAIEEDSKQADIAEDNQEADIADEHQQPDILDDHQQVDIADHHQQEPRLQNLEKADVANRNCVQTSEAQKENNVSTTGLFGELVHLQTSLALIAKHIVSVPKEDMLELFKEVKARVSEIETALHVNPDGDVVSDKEKNNYPNIQASTSPCEGDHDVNNDVTVGDVGVDQVCHDVDEDNAETNHVDVDHDAADHVDHDVDAQPMEDDNPDVSKATSVACEADNEDTVSDAARPMEIDKEGGKKYYNESQLGSMGVLLEACQVGITPDFPALDEHEPATQVGAFHENDIKQTKSIVNGDDEPVDDYLNIMNDDTVASRYSLDAIPFDNEQGKGVENEKVIEQVSRNNASCVEKDQTTPFQTDVEKDQTTPSQQIVSNQGYANVVCPNDKPCLGSVFGDRKMKKLTKKKKTAKARQISKNFIQSKTSRKLKFSRYLDSDNVQPEPRTTKRARLTRAAVSRKESIDPIVISDEVSGNPKTRSIDEFYSANIDPFVEDLSRHPKCKKDKVTLPDSLRTYLKQKKPADYKFPWGGRTIVAGRTFWLALACLEDNASGWLYDYHLDLWFDLMWSFRPSKADWTLTGTLFVRNILDGKMYDHYSNGTYYPVAWRDVEKVYFPVNEPGKHWCLAELHLRTGVVSFYDTLGCVHGNGKRWWRNMKRILPKQLTTYLHQQGILESKGIAAKDYKVTYQCPAVPEQAEQYGDCGVWVCIILYRLCHNLPLEVDDPLQTALAYRERMLEYLWKHKEPVNKD